ncbi:MAG: four-carbon acid sugar kinase family protein [Alphaproteobacteria bacterium]|nr:four-carbon acid sugar kinase family protein [Alphaproteobacteria bacterium]
MAPILGCVADDFTGATDLANMLVRGGMRTVQLIGVPDAGRPVPDVDAIVVALKSRTIAPADAVAQSVAALDWLKAAGCARFFFKYCSTFDSTDRGNIGPVADALLDRLDSDRTIACPAFPETGRTIFKGHLFVGDQLLSDSPMRHHPLTPMTESNLVAVLGRQTARGVGLIQFRAVAAGAEAIRAQLDGLVSNGDTYAIVDAVTDDQLHVIGEAVADLPLITGGSGVALGLPAAYRARGMLSPSAGADAVPAVSGKAAVLAGSCSAATLGQIAEWRKTRPSYNIDPLRLANGEDVAGEALAFLRQHLEAGPALVYASAPPETVKAIQAKLGREEAGAIVERAMAHIATTLVAEDGVRRLVVAGGETSGAVVSALGVTGLRIGAQIDPGVPGTVTLDTPTIALALKSGNFGGVDFFEKALAAMP